MPSGKVAIITGAGSGLGEAIAIRLSADGYKVCVNDLVLGSAERTVAQIRKNGGTAIAVAGDVSSVADTKEIARRAETELGPVHLLVNNAGFLHQCPIEDLEVEMFDRMIAVHVRGSFLMVKAVIKPMLERGEGNIINISSQLAHIGGEGMAHYCSAKAALLGLTKTMARELSLRGIRVNAVAPGATVTPLHNHVDPAWLEAKRKTLPLGRFAVPHEISATVAFLASDEASAFVGQTLGPNSGDVML